MRFSAIHTLETILTQRAYVLGPMTGYTEENRPMFRRATTLLRSLGYAVTSPDELDRIDPTSGKAWKDYMQRDIPWAVQAEIAFALPGWRLSKGATLEATILTALGVKIFEISVNPKGVLEVSSSPVQDPPVPVYTST